MKDLISWISSPPISNIIKVAIIPLIIAVLSLIIEYWIIQPIRESNKLKRQNETRDPHSDESLQSYLYRILHVFPHVDLYQASASLIDKVGSFIANLPRAIFVSIGSVISILLAMDLFVDLYHNEKLGICPSKPTCKAYLIEAIQKHGPLLGVILAHIRVARCGRIAKGKKDLVPENFVKGVRAIFSSTRRKGLNYHRQFINRLILLSYVPFIDAGLLVGIAYVTYKLADIQNYILLLLVSMISALFIWSLYSWLGTIIYKVFRRSAPIIVEIYHYSVGFFLVSLLLFVTR